MSDLNPTSAERAGRAQVAFDAYRKVSDDKRIIDLLEDLLHLIRHYRNQDVGTGEIPWPSPEAFARAALKHYESSVDWEERCRAET